MRCFSPRLDVYEADLERRRDERYTSHIVGYQQRIERLEVVAEAVADTMLSDRERRLVGAVLQTERSAQSQYPADARLLMLQIERDANRDGKPGCESTELLARYDALTALFI